VRLFVALWPPPEVVEALASLERPAEPSVRWTTPDQWHVTLRFLGDDSLERVAALLAGVSHPAVDVSVGPASSLLGRGILMVPVAGADSLAAALPLPMDRPFTGHLTLARARGRQGRVPSSLVGAPFSASWRATSFSLVRSQTEPTGAVYDDVATFPLG
jgi:2'-5' RNA ligase